MEIRSCTIVGSGLMARALGPALRHAGLTVVSVIGRRSGPTEALAGLLDAEPVLLPDIRLTSDCTFLCLPDRGIEELIGFLPERLEERAIVHTSGALPLAPLAPLRQRGAVVGKLHPLASLAGGAQRLRGCAWGIEADGDLTDELRRLAERLGGLPFDLQHTDAALYHLSAVFASNYLLAVVEAARQLWEESGAPLPAAEALLPLARGVLDNWQELGIEAALTGPIARGEDEAVARQLRTVVEEVPRLESLYRDLGIAAASIAARIPDAKGERIAQIARFLAKNQMVD